MDVIIRQLKPGDINYLTDIEIKCYGDAQGLDWWRHVLQNLLQYTAAATVHQVPVGFIVWEKQEYNNKPVACIQRLAVKPAFRRRSIGTQLLRHAALASRTNGMPNLMIAVPESLCFPGHVDDVSQWLLKREFRAVEVQKESFESYGHTEDVFVFLGPGLAEEVV